ncbi:MAG TPA: lysozyme inhibitor LprI family protein [Hyphomonadaceae bacterium]|nr:lysozyme inhibitor LprI family protein [Hyphomonadaceae bacterium]
MRARSVVLAIAIAAGVSAPAYAGNWGAIDCAKAKSPDEKAICASTELVQLDAQMSTEYGLLKGFLAMGGRGALMDAQKDWIKARATCAADTACLTRTYNDRIAALEKEFDRIKSNGPF